MKDEEVLDQLGKQILQSAVHLVRIKYPDLKEDRFLDKFDEAWELAQTYHFLWKYEDLDKDFIPQWE